MDAAVHEAGHAPGHEAGHDHSHRDLHSEQGALPGEHAGRARQPVVKVRDLAWLELEKPDLAAAEVFAHAFGFTTTYRSATELNLRGALPGAPCVVIRKGKEETRKVTLGRLEDNDKVQQAAAKTKEDPQEKLVTQKALGLDLAALSKDLRTRFKIKESVKGVVITGVDKASDAAEKRLSAGDVIVEVAQEAVTNAADIKKRVDQLKKDGKKSVLLLVANGDGELRFVALSVQ